MIWDDNKGTYALILLANRDFQCQIGKLAYVNGLPGSYIYVGSAFGQGGVKARIKHHLRLAEKPHWHLDYLRPYLEPKQVWFSFAPECQEHNWASIFARMNQVLVPVAKFGSSDCGCRSHLFYFKKTPSFSLFKNMCCDFVSSQGNEELSLFCKKISG